MAHEAERQPLGVFECQLCSLTAPYSYVGQKPPTPRLSSSWRRASSPRTPSPPTRADSWSWAPGAASAAGWCAWARWECSLFYSKRFCLPCVQENVHAFPQEIRLDLEKRKVPSKRPASQPSTQA